MNTTEIATLVYKCARFFLFELRQLDVTSNGNINSDTLLLFFLFFIYLSNSLLSLNCVTLWHRRSALEMVMIQFHSSYNYFLWFYACVFPAKIYTSKQQHYVFGNRFEFSVLIKFPLDFNSVIMIIFALQEKTLTCRFLFLDFEVAWL